MKPLPAKLPSRAESLKRFLTSVRHRLVTALRPRGKLAFLRSLPPGAKVLDVGCGNNSPRDFKLLRPDLVYTGLDIGDYNQHGSVEFADEYIVTSPAGFAAEIRRLAEQMDATVSAHNLEHCDEPEAVLQAMLGSVAPGGRIYLAFPCEESVRFPSRRGCLNFFDDSTHKRPPPWDQVLGTIRQAGWTVEYSRKRYRPWVLAAIGLVLEPAAALTGRNMPGGVGWALYGFESIIWASRGASVTPVSPPRRP
jgi:SAM-dependent methyltransferase